MSAEEIKLDDVYVFELRLIVTVPNYEVNPTTAPCVMDYISDALATSEVTVLQWTERELGVHVKNEGDK